ncbi:MAG: hypothetical protein JSW25_09415 [Thermoplasmata archaeon]|nr:MAG: hypothetical protein JSW25_09415 [Thermoplasmata archaeon]
MAALPEEEEYRAAQASGGMDVSKSFEEEVRELITMAFGIMVLLAILIVGLVAAFALTGWPIFLYLNLFVSVMAIVAFAWLLHRRSKLTMRL